MEALERIKEVINSGNTTKLDDWLELASSYKLSGSDNAEAIKNIEKFVTDNFSFETTAENAYVYFGSDGSVDMWQCVDIICKDTSQSSGYISSTQAGKLFNDVGFNEFLETILGEDNNLLKKVDGIKALYDGTDASGKVIIDAGNNETKEVQALNDFFSENYIKGIKSKNIKTIFSGDILARNNKGLNAFCRTELEQIFLNDNIENINGIEKSLIQKLKEAAPKGEEYDYVTNVLKASQISEIKDLRYTFEITVEATGATKIKVLEVSKNKLQNGTKLIDHMIANDKLESKSIYDIIKSCGDVLSEEDKAALRKLADDADQNIIETIIKDANEINIIKADSNCASNKLNDRLVNMLEHQGTKAAKYIVDNAGDISSVLGDNIKAVAAALSDNISGMAEQDAAKYITEYADEIVEVLGKNPSQLSKLADKFGDAATKINAKEYSEIIKNTNIATCEMTFSKFSQIRQKLSVEEIQNSINDSIVYLDSNGRIIGRNYRHTRLGQIIENEVPNEFVYKTTNTICADFADDATMIKKYGTEFNNFSSKEKLMLKEIDEFARKTEGLGSVADKDKALKTFCETSGKNASELTETDRMAIDAMARYGSQDSGIVSELSSVMKDLKSSSKLTKFLGGVKIAGYSSIAYMAVTEAISTIDKSNQAIANGEYGKAAGIVAGSSANMFLTYVGGEGLTNAILPAFLSVGAAFGPIGMVVGGVLAGVAGFTIMDKLGDSIENVFEKIGKIWDSRYRSATDAVRYRADPLVIDFDGDGFEILSVKDGVYFDNDAKGLKEKTAWVSSDDALLAIDVNGNGIIDDGSELFGTSTVMSDGNKAKSGFEALSQYDTNGDGIIDANDSSYAKLLIWQDKNGDGISRQDELVALDDAGIKSISLSTSDDTGRNVVSVTMTDGSTVSMGEFDFDAQYYNTREKNKPQISDEIAKQPDISAIGNVESLHTLMQNDKSGVLKGYIEQFAASDSRAEKETLVTKILYFITGADKVESGSRGSEIDAQKLAVVEKFEGREFIGTEGSNPVNTASAILNSIYNDIYDVYYSYLNAQTQLKGYMDLLYINEKKDGSYVINTSLFDKFIAGLSENGIDLSEVVGEVGRYIKTVNSDNATNFTNYLATYISNEKYYDAIVDICYKNQIKGSTNADTLQGSALDEVLFGNDGNDVLYGNDGNDLLVGGDGQDTLYGGNGDDVLIGGVGDDYLSGDAGTDIYIHSRGDGNCVINNYDASESRTSDKLVLNGVKKSEVEISRNGYDMIIRDTVSKETVMVKNAYNTSYGNGIFYLENVEFDDGKLGKNDLLKATSVRHGSDANDVIDGYGAAYNYSEDETIYAGAGDDTVRGNNGNDTIYGESGNDTLYGGNGDDVLIGGTGDDYLAGDAGADIYIHSRGDGNDVINNYDAWESRTSDKLVLKGVKKSDVEIIRNGLNMIIRDVVGNEVITIKDAYSASYGNGIFYLENVEFDDGSYGKEELEQITSIRRGSDANDVIDGYGAAYNYSENETIYAGAGDDTVHGNNGDDVIYGESGNDTLYGGNGDDVIVGGIGEDYLAGDAGADIYIHSRGDGNDVINNYDAWESRTSDKLVLKGVKKSDVEIIRNGLNMIIRDVVGNEVITIKDAYSASYGNGIFYLENVEFDDGSYGKEELEQITSIRRGSDANDVIDGYGAAYNYSENETIYAGAGDDTVHGYNGNDTIYGGDGNDTLYGGNGDDVIYGEEGNDKLYGGDGDDVLIGGVGNDYLSGDTGTDIYIHSRGDGNCVINNYDASESRTSDKLVLNGVKKSEVEISRNGYDMIIRDTVSKETVMVKNAYNASYGDGRYYLENVEFDDGSCGKEELEQITSVRHGSDVGETIEGYGAAYNYSEDETIYAGAGDDTVHGYNGNDTIYGGDGNDTLYGDNGDDVIIGGKGEDFMCGGAGADTYIHARGDGNDVINNYDTSDGRTSDKLILKGIEESEVEISRSGNDMVIRDIVGKETVTIKEAYNNSYGDNRYYLENIEYEDEECVKEKSADKQTAITEKSTSEQNKKKGDTLCKNTATVTSKEESSNCLTGIHVTTSGSTSDNNSLKVANETDKDKKIVKEIKDTESQSKTDVVKNEYTVSVSNESEITSTKEKEASVNNNHAVLDKKSSFNDAEPDVSITKTSDNKKEAGNTSLEKEVKTVDNIISNIEVVKVENEYTSIADTSQTLSASSDSITKMTELIIQDMSTDVSGNVSDSSLLASTGAKESNVQLWTN